MEVDTVSIRGRPQVSFFCLALGLFSVAHIGFEAFARTWVGRSTAWEAVLETLYYTATQPVGTLMLLAPFVTLGWLAGSLAKQRTVASGMGLFIGGAVVLCLIYFHGHLGAEQAMQQRKWTVAAIAVGLLPFKSIPVLTTTLVLRLLIGRALVDKED